MRTAKLASYENQLLALMGFTFAFVYFDRLSLNYIAPFIQKDLSLSNSQIGLLTSGLALTWSVSGFILSAVSDALGRRKIFLIPLIALFGLCSFGSGLAGGFLSLLMMRILMGFAEGPILPLAQSLMAQASSPKRRAMNMTILQNFINGFFIICAPLILVALAESVGWRITFFIAGLPGLLLAALCYRYVREPKEDKPPKESPTGGISAFTSELVSLLRYRNIRVSLLVSSLIASWMYLLLTFIPLYLIQVKGISASNMSVVMSMFGVAGFLSAFALPWISNFIGRRYATCLGCLGGIIAPLACLYVEDSFFALTSLIFLGFLPVVGCYPMLSGVIPSETVPSRFSGRAISLVLGNGEIIGGFVVVSITGILADIWGLELTLWIAAGAALIGGMFCLGFEETAPASSTIMAVES
ncbi:MFS transporter [Halomonas sp. WWR20]